MIDGTGGGYGNYPGLTVAEVAARFRTLAEEGHARSVRAILRIVHEQTSARGQLGAPRLVAGLALLAMVVLGSLHFVVAEEGRRKIDEYLLASTIVAVLFGVGAASMRRTERRAKAQVAEIRRLALLALERVVFAPGFQAKPLEREHLRSLNELRKTNPEAWGHIAEALGAKP